MKSLVALAQPVFEEEQPVETTSGEKGHWITIAGGKRIFIGEPALANKRLSTLDPASVPRGREIIMLQVKQKDGSFKEKKTYTYSDQWNRATARYKFAIANDIEKNREKIEGALEKEILAGKAGASLAVCALVIARTGMRVGQPGNATQNEAGEAEETFGATTLQRKHVSVEGDTTTFQFRGKSGVNQDIQITDSVIAQGIKAILAKGGEETGALFTKQTVVKGKKTTVPLQREDVSERFKRFNEHYKPKDFRTAIAMKTAIGATEQILSRVHHVPKKQAQIKQYAKALIKELGEAVSKNLGNTPAVAISNYTNPYLVEYMLVQAGITKEQLKENMRNIADWVASPYDTPVLVTLFGEDFVQAWFSSVAGSMAGIGEQDLGQELVEQTEIDFQVKHLKTLLPDDHELQEQLETGSLEEQKTLIELYLPVLKWGHVK
jgi:DNA topoisomerase IB